MDFGEGAGVVPSRAAQLNLGHGGNLASPPPLAQSARFDRRAAHVMGSASLMIDLVIQFFPMTPADDAQIEKLDERAFGPGRYARTAYRLREGVPPDLSLSFTARVGTLLVGANRMTGILVGETPALLLGPLTVEPAFRSQGVGEKLVKHSLDAARATGHGLVLLVGDLDYYARLGFARVPRGKIVMPGPVDPERLLYCELRTGAFEAAGGKMRRA
jgi:predicted N-acetyltransferase YhbS